MLALLDGLSALTLILRSALLAGGLVLAGVAAVDWAVRTRRINPFNGVARFMRARVEPRLAGIERQVTRVGAHPAATPWWALLAYIVFALLLIAGVDMLAGLVRDAAMASSAGPAGILRLVVGWAFGFLRFALLVRVLSSWIPRLAGSPWVRWSFGATEWMLRPLRRVIPTLGPVDLSPLVAYFGLQVVQWLVESVLLRGP